MALEWTNNWNDTADFDIVGFTLALDSGTYATAEVTLSAHSVAQYDDDGVPSLNWAVGDEFLFVGDTTVHSITSIAWTTGTTNADIGIAGPGLSEAKSPGLSGYKEESYRGLQRSAENHLRLRNQGQI
jgi:hypothetical protein